MKNKTTQDSNNILQMLKVQIKQMQQKYDYANIPSSDMLMIAQNALTQTKTKYHGNKVTEFINTFTIELEVLIKEYIKEKLNQDQDFTRIIFSYIKRNLSFSNEQVQSQKNINMILSFLEEYEHVLSLEQYDLLLQNEWIYKTIEVIVNYQLEKIKEKPLSTLFDKEELNALIEKYCIKNHIDLYQEEIIEDFSSNMQISKDPSNKILSYEEVVELFKRLRMGDKEAEETLINRNLGLVRKIARKYSNKGVMEYDDLFQEGLIGLMTAIKKYDYQKEYHFSTYAVWWIRQNIVRATNNRGNAIRIPVHINDKLNKLLSISERIEKTLNKEPTIEELKREMGLTEDQVKQLIRVREEILNPFSLNKHIGGDEEDEIGSFVRSETDFTEEITSSFLKEEIDTIFNAGKLTKREEDVLRMRIGLDGNSEKTLEEIGKMYHLTRERIRQIEAKALKKLRLSQAVLEMVDYVGGSTNAIQYIKIFREKYYEALQLKDKTSPIDENIKKYENSFKEKKSITPIYFYLKEYSKSDVDLLIPYLSNVSKKILAARYESNMIKPATRTTKNDSLFYQFFSRALPELRSLLERNIPEERRISVPVSNEKRTISQSIPITIYDIFSEYPKDLVDEIIFQNPTLVSYINKYYSNTTYSISLSFLEIQTLYERILPNISKRLQEKYQKTIKVANRKNIYEEFDSYPRETIEFVISRLDKEDHDLLILEYGIDLMHPRIYAKHDEVMNLIRENIFPRMEKMIRNINLKSFSEDEINFYFYSKKEKVYSLYSRFPNIDKKIIEYAICQLSLFDQETLRYYQLNTCGEYLINNYEQQKLEPIFDCIAEVIEEVEYQKKNGKPIETYIISKKETPPPKEKKKNKSIYERYPQVAKEEIDSIIASIFSEQDQKIIEKMENGNHVTKKEYARFYNGILKRIKNKLESIRILKAKEDAVVSNETLESLLQSTDLFYEGQDFEKLLNIVLSTLSKDQYELVQKIRQKESVSLTEQKLFYSNILIQLKSKLLVLKKQNNLEDIPVFKDGIQTIYEMLPEYSKEQIDIVISNLSGSDQMILKRINQKKSLSITQYLKLHQIIYPEIKKQIQLLEQNGIKKKRGSSKKDIYERFPDIPKQRLNSIISNLNIREQNIINKINQHMSLKAGESKIFYATIKKKIYMAYIKNESIPIVNASISKYLNQISETEVFKQLLEYLTEEEAIIVYLLEVDKLSVTRLANLFQKKEEEIMEIAERAISICEKQEKIKALKR